MSLKFSIITPSYNQGRFISDTIESVLNQNYCNFEHIVIDGGSNDNTLDVLKRYSHLKWLSEKDNGPADAIIKGFKLADGDILCWLNADDYFDKNVFNVVSREFSKNDDKGLVIGGLTFINEDKKVLFVDKTHRLTIPMLIYQTADLIRQPSTFFRKDLYFSVGGLDTSLKLVFDYDLFIKMLKISNAVFVDQNFSFQRDYSTTLSRLYARRQGLEIFKVSRKNGGKIFDIINKRNIKKIILNRF